MFEQRMAQPGSSIEKTGYEKEEKELKAFVEQGGYTAYQMREAYYRLCGVSDNDDADPAVEAIRSEMQRMVDDHFPLNRLAKLIGSKQDFEDMVPKFYQFIENLEITANEKGVLRSIVDNERAGKIECHVGDKMVGAFEIKESSDQKEQLAAEMTHAITLILVSLDPSDKYEFWFEEK